MWSESQPVVDPEQRMRDDMDDPFRAREGAELVQVSLQALQLAMLRLGHAEHEDV